MRLQKYIALCGIASRRAGEELIRQGRVSVNGVCVTEMGILIDETKDLVEVDGAAIQMETKKYYIMLHKPKEYVTTVSDPFGRPTVLDLVKDDIPARIYPVGRLDYDTEGLLLLTNDGAFANCIMHPKEQINKTYIARVLGLLEKEAVIALRTGVEIDGRMTAPAKVEVVKTFPKSCDVKITIHEGRNRQVRKMIQAVGHSVYSLKRIAVGPVSLGNLASGKWRHLNLREIQALKGGRI